MQTSGPSWSTGALFGVGRPNHMWSDLNAFSTSFSCGWRPDPEKKLWPTLAYDELMRSFSIPSLKARRLQYDLVFLRNIYRGQVDSPFLLSCFPLHIPGRATRRVVCRCFNSVCPCEHGEDGDF